MYESCSSPERGADHVHVSRRVLGRVQVQRVAVDLSAGGPEHHLLGDAGGGLDRVVGCVVGVQVRLDRLVVDAVDAARAVDAAGVEADDVEATREAHPEVQRLGSGRREVVPRTSRPTWVEQDGALADLRVGRIADHCEVDGRTGRIVVVQRHRQRRALQRLADPFLAGAPGEVAGRCRALDRSTPTRPESGEWRRWRAGRYHRR